MNVKKNVKVYISILTLLLITLISVFQNCSRKNNRSTNSSLGSESESPLTIRYDTIAFMGCNGMKDFNDRAYFTFAGLAYKNGTSGIALTESFFETTKNMSDEKRCDELNDNYLRLDGQPVVAVRKVQDPISGIISNGKKNEPIHFEGEPPGGSACANFMENHKTDFSNTLGLSGFDWHLGFSGFDEETYGKLLDGIQKDMAIYTTFNESGSLFTPILRGGEVGPWGTAIFCARNGVKDTLGRAEKFDKCIQKNSQSFQTLKDGELSCPDTSVFLIVRPEEENLCPDPGQPPPESHPEHELWVKANRLLGGLWYINLQERCIRIKNPNHGDCYSSAPTFPVEYQLLDGGRLCGEESAKDDPSKFKHCAKYFSMCEAI